MSKIDKIIKDIDMSLLKKKFEDKKTLIDYVAKFIIKKKLMLYGGFAINLLLPTKLKFYHSYTINDYDCFSKNAKDDAIELGKFLAKQGYKYIKVKKALHKDTFRVYVDFVQIIDITQISSNLYDNLYKISDYESKTSIYRYYKDNYKLVPVIYLLSNMHFELARPKNSYFRWEKLYSRLNILLQLIMNKKIVQKNFTSINNEVDKKIIQIVLKYVKQNQLPLLNTYSLRLHHEMFKNIDNNIIEFLTDDIQKSFNELIQLIDSDKYDLQVSKNISQDITNNSQIINVSNKKNKKKTIIKIIDVNNECYSVFTKNKYIYSSIDTILYFLYRDFLKLSIEQDTIDFQSDLWKYILYLEYYLQNFIDNPGSRFGKKCYGKTTDLASILKENWKKKLTIEYI